MLDTLPSQVEAIRDWAWEDFQTYFDELLSFDLKAETLDNFMQAWTRLNNLIMENFSRAQLAVNQDTTDEKAENYLKGIFASIYPNVRQASDQLNRKLVESGLQPENFALPLKKMQTDIELYNEENAQLSVQERELGMGYSKIVGAQTVEWNGEEKTLAQLKKVLQDDDRDTRERAWRAMMYRWLEDREAINDTWTNLFDLRQQMAKNAGFENYRAFRWKDFKRFDYSPEDCETFHRAIEEVVVPVAKRRNEIRRRQLGVDTLRPWDLDVDPSGAPPLSPWETVEDFAAKTQTVFSQVDPQLGEYFGSMRQNEMLDLPNRKGKGPGAFCTNFPTTGSPFIFMNAVGNRDDVRTLLHESGHAFHNFEVMANLPYSHQRAYPIEFAEVASMAMELLSAPYLTQEHGGYFTQQEAARDRIAHLERIIFFWPYMAVVDSFQHWAYSNGDLARDPAACDDKWSELWDRFIQVDYSGLEDVRATGWHRKQHIYNFPFYYIEYGLAQLGAVQVWANALKDQAGTVEDYRKALALGGTRSLPELYGAAGVKFAFDADTLGEAVNLIERTIADYEG